jgi:flagellar protein FlgJ
MQRLIRDCRSTLPSASRFHAHPPAYTFPLVGLAADPKALGDLKRRAAEDPEGALKLVATQFEALLLDIMMKSMRSAAPGESLLDNEGSRLFTSLLDQEFSRKLSEQGGLGLADLLVKQLSQLRGSGQKRRLLPIKL